MNTVSVDYLLTRTPRQIEEEYKDLKNLDDIIKQINKTFEGRPLGKGQ